MVFRTVAVLSAAAFKALLVRDADGETKALAEPSVAKRRAKEEQRIVVYLIVNIRIPFYQDFVGSVEAKVMSTVVRMR